MKVEKTPPVDTKAFRAWARAWLKAHPVPENQQYIGCSMFECDLENDTALDGPGDLGDFEIAPPATMVIRLTLTTWDWKALIEAALDQQCNLDDVIGPLIRENCEIHTLTDDASKKKSKHRLANWTRK